MMKLYICEKPSQGRDLARNLGVSGGKKGYIGGGNIVVTWAIGHIIQQAMPYDYDIKFKNFKTNYEFLPFVPEVWKMLPNKRTHEQLNVVKNLIKKATDIVIATDGDREGELIGRELLDYFNYNGTISRLWLTALDDNSILKSLKNIKKGSETVNLYDAGLARARADWLVGLNLTQLITVKTQMQGFVGCLSVGRVRTPTLAMVVNRDFEIANFVSKDYFDICGIFSGVTTKWQHLKSDYDVNFDSENRCINSDYANEVVARVKNNNVAKVVKFETQRKKVSPPLLYDLSALQQTSSKKFGFSSKQTLDLAQSLYETHKVTTYPRSDCKYLPEEQLSEVVDVMKSITSIDSDMVALIKNANLQIKSKVWNNKKLGAHHGIIPTQNTSVDASKMTTDECKLYDLICRSYIAQFYPNYEYDKTTIVVSTSDESFEATVSIDVNMGWKKVISVTNVNKETVVPDLELGQNLSVDNVEVQNKKNQTSCKFYRW